VALALRLAAITELRRVARRCNGCGERHDGTEAVRLKEDTVELPAGVPNAAAAAIASASSWIEAERGGKGSPSSGTRTAGGGRMGLL
jgi:hypothetical protein